MKSGSSGFTKPILFWHRANEVWPAWLFCYFRVERVWQGHAKPFHWGFGTPVDFTSGSNFRGKNVGSHHHYLCSDRGLGLLCPLSEASQRCSHIHDVLGICSVFMYLILGLRGQRSVMIGPIEILDEKSNGGPVILIIFDHSLRFCMHEFFFFL